MAQLSQPIHDRTYTRKVYIASIISLYIIAFPHIWTATLPKTLFFFGYATAFTLGYFLLKNLKNQFYIKAWYITLFWVGFTLYSVYTGGIWASALVILILLPIIALGFVSVKQSVIILCLICFTYILLFVLQDYIPDEIPAARPLWIMITMITATVTAFLFVYFYRALSFIQTKKLMAANDSLEVKQAELDEHLQLVNKQNEQITRDKINLEKRNTKLEKYTESIIEIANMEELHEGDFGYTIEILLQSIKNILGVDIVSIWQYDENKNELILISQNSDLPNSGINISSRLKRSDFPYYFDHVLTGMIIMADDVFENKYTYELIDDYFKKDGIASLLDCPYYVDGKFAGVICCKTLQQRNWGPEDSIFVKGISNMAGISLSALHRMTHIKNLEIDNLEMKLSSKELKQKVIDGDEMLENLSEKISEYADINAHKLRGPVCRLLGLLELLEKSKSSEDVFQIKNFLTNNINELNQVTLDFGEKLNQLDVD